MSRFKVGDVVVLNGIVPGTERDVEGELGVVLEVEDFAAELPIRVLVGDNYIWFWLRDDQAEKIDSLTEVEMEEVVYATV